MAKARLTSLLMTAAQPGAVAMIQVAGEAAAVERLLGELTGRSGWPVGRLKLVDLAGIDEGLAGRIGEGVAQLMPHGGPRVVQKLMGWLADHGAAADGAMSAGQMFPEAESEIEAEVLRAVATASSPAAIDLLAAQPRLWRAWAEAGGDGEIPEEGWRRHLLMAPTVVVVGPPNVGKSTLLNQLVGRSASVVADLPGTTRDWVGALVELPGSGGGGSEDGAVFDAVAVRWLDTPGLRESDDAIEQRAIELAKSVIASADVLVAMRDPRQDWPAVEQLPRTPDLWVVNKADLLGAGPAGSGDGVELAERDESSGATIAISAEQGDGVGELIAAVRGVLGVETRGPAGLWPFSPTLKRWAEVRPTRAEMDRYLGEV